MSALPRPVLPPGPQRELVTTLHDLHHHAGWPSLRALAKETGVSHTTISKAFSQPTLPTWGTLELLVEAMDGDSSTFHQLWLAASMPTNGNSDGPRAARLAGRRTELDVVRRHLESGTGLLVVTGEAGIGKTRLVTTAAATTEVFVAFGHCLPLSSAVPLLPVASALREVYESDGGTWLAEALAACPHYVRGTLGRLLPELAEPGSTLDVEGGPPPHLLGSAVRSVLSALRQRRDVIVVVEDLHWADTATLELLELLLTQGTAPMLGTWRLDDPHIALANAEWFTRVRRMPTVTTMSLKALSADETAEQLTLLTSREPDAALVESIHLRSQGLPLFTEQLAAEAGSDGQLPSLLSDLLDARLGDLVGPAWSAARTLGLADRPVDVAQLERISGLDPSGLTAALGELGRRSLLSAAPDTAVSLRHPLLAEAIRRRLVPGEAAQGHASIARTLAGTADPEPAEVAHHWRAAGEPRHELVWRIHAARAAHERFALRHEVTQWVRALDLWPDDELSAADLPARRTDVLVAALDLAGGLEREQAASLADEALRLVPGLPPLDAAELLQRAGPVLAEVRGEIDLGLELLHRAIDLYELELPSSGHTRALFALEMTLRGVGRHEEAADAVARGLNVAQRTGDPGWHRRMLIQQAWFEARAGDHERARGHARTAAELRVDGPDPRGEALLAGTISDILLLGGGEVDEVVAVGQRGLDAVEPWGLDTYSVMVIRCNMALAMRRAGQIGRAVRFLAPHTGPRALEHEAVLEFEMALLDAIQDRTELALARVAKLDGLPPSGIEAGMDEGVPLALVEIWVGRTTQAFARLVGIVTAAAPTDASRGLGEILALAARTAADDPELSDRRQQLLALHQSCAVDPFAHGPGAADVPAWAATWTAELDRLADDETVEHWLAPARAWDSLTRPHDAAYCRWRAAQVALRTEQGTLAARLLKRAARDAREHVPLSEAIARTAAG